MYHQFRAAPSSPLHEGGDAACAVRAAEPHNYRIRPYEQASSPSRPSPRSTRPSRLPPGAGAETAAAIHAQMDKAVEEAEPWSKWCRRGRTPRRAGRPLRHSGHIAGQGRIRPAMQIDSTDVGTLMSLADFYNGRHDYRAVLDVTQRLFESDKMPLDTKIKRFGIFTSDMRFYREYYPQLNTLASTLAVRYPQDRRVVELYAKHLIASGELEQALALYKLHLDDQPPVEEYFRSVIDIESYLQHPDSVNRYIGRALELFPGQVDFHLSKGHTLNYSKQYPQAIKAYKQSLGYARTDSLRSVIWGFIGDTWHQKATAGEQDIDNNFARAVRKGSFRADMKQCYKAYDHSLRYDPDNAMVLNNYAYFLSLEGRELEKALTMSSRAIALTDNNPTYLDTHAWVLFKLGRTAEAKKVMQQAIALDGQESAALLVHYGDILHAMGEQFMAEIYWRKGLEKGYDADQITRRMEQGKAEKE
ncbi:MAG: tetratricopeptide repeat protein [Alistipes onderdonkii]